MFKLKILIVDDDESIRKMLKVMLESKGYEIITVDNAEDGVLMARSKIPALILMDVMLPDMNGAEAKEVLAQDASTKKIPIIFMTGMITRAEEAEEVGLNIRNTNHSVIAKPIDNDDLLHLIRQKIN